MLNKGVVTDRNGKVMTVTFERPEACGDCHNCPRGSESCKKHEILLQGDARIGDMVEVELDDSHVIMASMVAYLIPLAGFLIGLAAGYFAAPHFEQMNPELVMAIAALIGTVLAYLFMRIIDPHFSKGRWEPRIVSIEHVES
ncbi:MAG: SoxR reducing system RseC family protein [Clostridia bacterium]|nr:SoxR reducing system RseC family protein [Clostridia bacterium]